MLAAISQILKDHHATYTDLSDAIQDIANDISDEQLNTTGQHLSGAILSFILSSNNRSGATLEGIQVDDLIVYHTHTSTSTTPGTANKTMALFQNGVYWVDGGYGTSGSPGGPMTVDPYRFTFESIKVTSNNLVEESTDNYSWKKNPLGSGGAGGPIPGKNYILTDQGWVLDKFPVKMFEESNDAVKTVSLSPRNYNSLVGRIRDSENLAGKNIYAYLQDRQIIQIPQPTEGSVPMSKTATFSTAAVAFPMDQSATHQVKENDSAFVADKADVYASLDEWVRVIQSAGGFSLDGRVYNIYKEEIGTWQKTTIHGISAIDIKITNTSVYSGVSGTCGREGRGCNQPLVSDDYLALFSDGRGVVVHHEKAIPPRNFSEIFYYFNKAAIDEIINSLDMSPGNYWKIIKNEVEIGGGTPATTPPSSSFAAITPVLTSPRAGHTATLLQDGKVLIAGGFSTISPGLALSTAELYDPAANTFTAVAGAMRMPRTSHKATILGDGRVLLTGGQTDNNHGNGSNTSEIFDPTTQTFSSVTATMTTPRGGHSATLLSDGRVLLFGGFNNSSVALNTAELFDPSTQTFAALANKMTLGRSELTATLLPNGRVLLSGGSSSNTDFNTAETFDPSTQGFTAIAATMMAVRSGHGASPLANGSPLITGGAIGAAPPSSGTILDTAEAFNPATQTFSAIGARMTSPRFFHSQTTLANGSILLTGGVNFNSSGSFIVLNSAELFTP